MCRQYLFKEDDKMSDKDVELDIDGKGSIKIPWKVVLIMLGLAATAMGLGEDAFKAVLETVG
tara:strand:+ start:611 stop:796 length:186 start_codon:yes stop_codon:yes gene_type:complete